MRSGTLWHFRAKAAKLQPMAPAAYPWKRYWLRRDSELPTFNGIVFGPDDWPAAPGPLRATDEVMQCDVLLMLGEPGAGKSSAVRRAEEHRWGARAPADCFRRLELGYCRERADLESELEGALSEWREQTHTLHLFLDGLDEALQRDPVTAWHVVFQRTLNKIEHSERNRLRIRVVCRAAELPWAVESDLKGWNEGGTFEALKLAPLVRSEIAIAAEKSGIDVADFFLVLQQRSAQELAAHPLTLSQLLINYDELKNGSLSLSELFGRGCRRMCEEPQDRQAREFFAEASDRLAAAKRISLASVLTNVAAFSLDTTMETTGLTVRDFCASLGRDTTTERAIRETLRATSLFTSVGAGVLAFCHPCYRDYLAACCVKELSIPWHSLRGAIVVRSCGRDRIPPHLQELVGWVAGFQDDVWNDVVAFAPEVLCHPQTRVELRPRLLEALFEWVRLPENGFHVGDERAYRALSCPDLSGRVERIVEDRSEMEVVRLLAVEIAEACRLVELGPLMIRVACDVTLASELRFRAATTLEILDVRGQENALLALLQLSPETDPDHILFACALERLWPDSLRASELTGWLSTRRVRSYAGIYAWFIRSKLVERARAVDLVALLSWTAGSASILGPRLRDELMLQLVDRIGRSMEPSLLDGLAEYIAGALACSNLPVLPTSTGNDSPANNQMFRQALLQRLSAKGCQPSAFRTVARSWIRLGKEDFSWLATCVDAAPSEKERTFYRELACFVSDPNDASHVAEAVRLALPILNHHAERALEALVPAAPEVDMWLEAIKALEDGGTSAIERWLRFTLCLGRDVEGKEADRMDVADIQLLPGWPRLDDRSRGLALQLAERVLADRSEREDEYLRYSRSSGVLRAALLLETQAKLPELSASVVDDLLVARRTVRDHFRCVDLFRGIYARQPKLMREVVVSRLRTSADSGSLYDMLPLWDSEIQSSLEDLLGEQLAPQVEEGVVAALFDHKSDAVSRYARTVLHSRLRGEQGGGEVLARWLLASPNLVWKDLAGLKATNSLVLTKILEVVTRKARFDRSVLNGWATASLVGVFLESKEVDERSQGLDELRGRVLDELVHRGDADSHEALVGLSQRDPGRTAHYNRLAYECSKVGARKNWASLEMREVAELFEQVQRPVVHDSASLLELLVRALSEIDASLQGETPAVADLWNECERGYRPKNEDAFTNWVKRQLAERLTRYRIISARNVEIVSKTGAGRGQEVDLLVSVLLSDGRMAKVVIEAKGCWNKELKTAMRGQLVERYLETERTACGLFLVGWFDCLHWEASDSRQQQTPRWDLTRARAYFDNQAEELSTKQQQVRAVVLNTAYK